MTDEKQAIRTLADNLVKAMKTVSANTPVRRSVSDGGGGGSGSSISSISASKVTGLPNVFKTLMADTAYMENIYATFGDFITLVAEDATIGSLDVETIRAGLAEVGLINIGTASIDMAQIKRSSTQTAFIHESVQGKVYIDDLAVSDASIVNLAAGTVLINDSSGNLVELYVDATTGDVSTRAVSYNGSNIINQNSLNGNRIVNNSITTSQLNASEIFAAQGTIMNLIADNIDANTIHVVAANIDGTLTASQIDATNLQVAAANITGKLTASQIDATNLQVAAANITGKLTASQINSTDLHVSSANIDGVLNANKISGGTLIVGGNNNTNGTIVVKDENNAEIGKWSKDGININKGVITSSTIQNGNDVWNSNGITINDGKLVVNNQTDDSSIVLSSYAGGSFNYTGTYGSVKGSIRMSGGRLRLNDIDPSTDLPIHDTNIAIGGGSVGCNSIVTGSLKVENVGHLSPLIVDADNITTANFSKSIYHQIKANIINYDTLNVPFSSGKCIIKRRDTSGQNGVRMLIIGVNAVASDDEIYAIRYADMWDYQLINKTSSNATVTVDVISINYEDVTDKGHWVI